ncbi:LacI family DNA-binding transcriptional regulator [Serinicoccus marinus]|uniref:LacI family DNA-binding transcriptional regulator n=1 Tax=Serinicoccus marinus TaxID=247333 RepID=UPI001EE7817B|nr:LacI family DNA-binding transcriptional regulator [Serinicoccus marinus]
MAEAVRRAAAELDYSIDRTARSLRRRYSDVVALVVPDVENPFFTAVARGVEDVAREAGLSLVLCNSDDDPEQEARYVEVASEEQMAGLILAPAGPDPRLDPLLRKGRTVVVIDRLVDAPLDHVVLDNQALGRIATEHLLALGHRRIACITGPQETSTARERAEGWAQALTAAGATPDPQLLLHATYRVEGGQSAMHELLDLPEPPEAVVATNNMVGVGLLRALSTTTHHAAPQVSVIGDLPFITSDVAGAVTMPLHPREMGTRAAQMFVERLQGETGPPRRVVLDPTTPEPLTRLLTGPETR